MKEYEAMACIFEGKLKCASAKQECEKCDAKELFQCQPATVILKEVEE